MHDLLCHWQKTTNLISKKSIPDIWSRHFADSAQLALLAPKARVWMDLGSGAGFPGLVVAILRQDIQMHLVESTSRKAAFLQTVCREAGVSAVVHNCRIEALKTQNPVVPDVISARALANLRKLLDLATPLAGAYTQFLFQKGLHMVEELEEATRYWDFKENRYESLTDPDGRILMISEPRRKNQAARENRV